MDPRSPSAPAEIRLRLCGQHLGDAKHLAAAFKELADDVLKTAAVPWAERRVDPARRLVFQRLLLSAPDPLEFAARRFVRRLWAEVRN